MKSKAKASQKLYQFKITLKNVEPPIWRRIQVENCSLDELHNHIQAAMGWTNSHLHQFTIRGVLYGNPDLLLDGDDVDLENSVTTRLSTIISQNRRLRFDYEYDFGDGWEHEILFEGFREPEPAVRYPICLEGERACPPEDVGGPFGYQECVEAFTDPDDSRREEFVEWIGQFDPEQFDAQATTQRMRG